MNASDKILQKALVASSLDSQGWSKIQAGLRNRAFFSAQVEQQKILHAMRSNVADLLDQKKSPSEIRRDLRNYLNSIKYDPGENAGTIKDLRTKGRIDVMMQTNADQAKGFMSYLRATTEGAIMAFPGFELIRTQARKVPRDWHSRWRIAGAEVAFEGVAAASDKMIALKTSPIWTALSAFGNPFPPFDYNSGMGLRDVPKSVCRMMGLLAADEQPKIPEQPDFNGSLKTEVDFSDGSDEFGKLREAFGDQIAFDKNTNSVEWRSDLLSEELDQKDDFTIELGVIQKNPILADLEKAVGSNPLTMTKQNWMDVKRSLKTGDIDMMPSVWRNPDKATKIDYNLYELKVDAVDGGDFVLEVEVKNGIPAPRTFTRTNAKIN